MARNGVECYYGFNILISPSTAMPRISRTESVHRAGRLAGCLIVGLATAAVCLSTASQQPVVFDEPSPISFNTSLVSGPAVGEKIPAFSALDQNGVTRGFEDLKGRNGALIVFFRSADW